MILTKRQTQVAALTQYGASIKEIATVLGMEENTVKSHKKKIAVVQKRLNRDMFGMPVKREDRMVEFQKIINRVNARLEFGETQSQSDA